MSIGPRIKYGRARHISFCPQTNNSVFAGGLSIKKAESYYCCTSFHSCSCCITLVSQLYFFLTAPESYGEMAIQIPNNSSIQILDMCSIVDSSEFRSCFENWTINPVFGLCLRKSPSQNQSSKSTVSEYFWYLVCHLNVYAL